MSEYSVEEARVVAKYMRGHGNNLTAANLIDAYADLREQIERAREGYVMVPSEPTDAMCGVVEYGAASRMCETRLSERKDFLRKAITAGSHPPAQAAQDVADEARDTSITDAFDAMHPITTAEPVAQGEAVDEIEDFGKDHEWDGQKWVRKAAQPASPEQPARYRDAYEGAREDLLDWKGRAQRAEAELRKLGYTGIDASEQPAGRQGEAVACRYRFGDGNGGWLGWHYTDSSTKKTIPGDVVQVEPLYTHPAAPAGMPVAWQQKRRPEDYPDEWRECGKETFDVINRTKDSPWVARELFECPAAPVGVPDAWPKLELWFFRELVEAQRLKLFALHGMPVDEIGASHIEQKRALRQLLAAPSAPQEKKACTRNCDCVGPCKMRDE